MFVDGVRRMGLTRMMRGVNVVVTVMTRMLWLLLLLLLLQMMLHLLREGGGVMRHQVRLSLVE